MRLKYKNINKSNKSNYGTNNKILKYILDYLLALYHLLIQ